jgi:hypothetical protein
MANSGMPSSRLDEFECRDMPLASSHAAPDSRPRHHGTPTEMGHQVHSNEGASARYDGQKLLAQLTQQRPVNFRY